MIRPLLLLILFINPVQKYPAPVITLPAEWRFEIGDDFLFATPEYDDSNWSLIKVPAPWENAGFPGYDGYAWYRTWFHVPDELEMDHLYLKLGRIDDVDEVFLNGEKIANTGQFPPHYKTAWDQVRVYKLPVNLLKSGEKNLLAIRIYDYHISGGIYEGPVGIYQVPPLVELKINCAGKWKFSLGDSSHWGRASFADSAWAFATLPGELTIKTGENTAGVAWYRKKIDIPATLSTHRLFFVTGPTHEWEQVYFNGELISSTDPILEKDFQETQTDSENSCHFYILPQNLIRFNAPNTLALRVQMANRKGYIFNGPVGITTERVVTNFHRTKH